MSQSLTWNEVYFNWNETDYLWNEDIIIQDVVRGGGSLQDDWDKKDNEEKKRFIKIYIVYYNEFLTPQQKQDLKVSGAYPTYSEFKEINNKIKAFMKGFRMREGIKFRDTKAKIKIDNVKLGVNKLINYAKNYTLK